MKSIKTKISLDKVKWPRKALFKTMAIEGRETELSSTEAKGRKVLSPGVSQ